MQFSSGERTILHSASRELIDWAFARSASPPACSINLCTHHALDLTRLGSEISVYLNEFDPESMGSWRSFDYHLIRQAAGDPEIRRAIRAACRRFHKIDESCPDFDQMIIGLGTLGHAILQGDTCHSAIKDNPNIFKFSLNGNQEHDHDCDLWLNAHRFNPPSQVTSIGDSFLDWLSRRQAQDSNTLSSLPKK